MSTDTVSGTRPRSRLERRVIAAAKALLAHDGSVSPVDVLAAIGWLPQSTVDRWRQGRVACLEHLAPVRPDKLAAALEHLRGWAAGNALAPSEVAYVSATRDRRPLRFTADGNEATERAWRTHWIRADLPEAARKRLTQRQSKPPDLTVIEPLNEWSCTACGGSGWLLFMEGPGPLCMDCADLHHLVFLPAGNATRAGAPAGEPAVGGRGAFQSRSQALRAPRDLVEEAALERAEAQCLADEDARASAASATGSAAPTRTWCSRRGWPNWWGGCSPAARWARRGDHAACGGAGQRPGWPVGGRAHAR